MSFIILEGFYTTQNEVILNKKINLSIVNKEYIIEKTMELSQRMQMKRRTKKMTQKDIIKRCSREKH